MWTQKFKYKDDTIENPDLCDHKQQPSKSLKILMHVDIRNRLLSMWTQKFKYKDDTIENPDVCGHKQQPSLYVDIKAPIQC